MPVPITKIAATGIAATRIAATSGLAALGLFQAGLAAGMPWGSAAYGGGHPGRLPARLRTISAVAAPAYLASAAMIGAGAAPRGMLRVVAGVMAVAVIPNAASPSPKERFWAPVCAAIAIASAMELRRPY
ncbi:hypothetical protein ACFORJ_11420 [Corynebacterium hansenii]|uniref:Integral membrane protein n=1 Tax=Corynebacterium hansenii TaxID=394964 RepID=A0ABV7ZRK7_9CORY|nr:hypothetical protein [Corynebacterium hansenii]WJY99908.1 hypothetical protein CHAN_06470 [Corynebacterium hansenii]